MRRHARNLREPWAQTTYPEPQQQSAPQKTDDTMMSAKSFAKLDVNADGKISKQEAAADPSLNKMFASPDAYHGACPKRNTTPRT